MSTALLTNAEWNKKRRLLEQRLLQAAFELLQHGGAAEAAICDERVNVEIVLIQKRTIQ